jgi:tRNA threonylcarbamoyladenosine biosynthesis protein TsaB
VPGRPLTPLVLALDTTHEYGSLALARGCEVLEEVALHAPGGFAHIIYGHLRELLERCGVTLDAVDCFAAASGPGSFTGVRVGLACIKGLAEAMGRPAAAVSNLQALAACGSAALRAPLLDARRGEVYGAVYDSELNLMREETVAALPVWLASLPPEPLEFITADLADAAPLLPGPLRLAPRALAAAVAGIAAVRFERGQTRDPAALDANYVRRSDAELFWRE